MDVWWKRLCFVISVCEKHNFFECQCSVDVSKHETCTLNNALGFTVSFQFMDPEGLRIGITTSQGSTAQAKQAPWGKVVARVPFLY